MEVNKFKILEADFVGKGVSAQTNPMQKAEDEAKAVFDELVKDVVTPKFNAFVDAFQEIDLTADRDKPVSTAMQEALDELDEKKMDREDGKVLSDNNFTDQQKTDLQANTEARHSHGNKAVLDGITAQDISDWRGGNVLTKDNQTAYEPTQPYHPATVKYVADTVKNVGAADMMKAVYDPQNKSRDIFKYVDDAVEDAMGNIPTPDVSGQISSHNTDSNAHRGMFAEADHSHTAAEVGAAEAVHTHGLADVGISYGTEDLEAGVSELPAGTVYLVYTM